MTTIAIKDGVMACDSQVTTGHTRSELSFNKIMLHDDAYYGFAGSCHAIDIIKEYIKGNVSLGDIPDKFDVTYLVMPKNGKPYQAHVHNCCKTTMPLPKNYAIGSGSEFAMVAMSCGKSAIEAIKEAIKWDVFSGGKVKSYSFNTETKRKVHKAPFKGKLSTKQAREAVKAVKGGV